MDDRWRLRLRRDAFLPPDPGPAAGGCPTFLGKVVSTGSNLGVGKFMAVNPVDATGAETEGGSGTLTADTAKTVLVYALGPTAPATGDYVICRHVNHRWVAGQQAAGGGVTIVTPPFCNCGVPSTLTMTSSNESCNCAMYRSCGLTYSATCPYSPAPASGGSAGWYSDATFASNCGGVGGCDYSGFTYNFYYALRCVSSNYTLVGVYLDGPFPGSTFPIGNGGNGLGFFTCATRNSGVLFGTFSGSGGYSGSCFPAGDCSSISVGIS